MNDMYTRSVQIAEKVGVVSAMPRMNARKIQRQYTSRERGEILQAKSADSVYRPCYHWTWVPVFLLFWGKTSTSRMLWTCTKTIFPHLIVCLLNWFAKFANMADKPNSLAQALKVCDEMIFLNIFVLLKMVCTLSVTLCECERSLSTILRLYTYLRQLRASVGQEHL